MSQSEKQETGERFYPELDKMSNVAPASQTIGDFLAWAAMKKGYHLMEEVEVEDDRYDGSLYTKEMIIPVRQMMESMLAEFFNIDLKKVEEEKQAILDGIKEKNKR